jgi:hypothetical protein
MRMLSLKMLVLGLALAGVASPLDACGPDMIEFPGSIELACQRNNHVFCVNDKNHLVVVDLLSSLSFDLGPVGNRRCDGDVVGDRALVLTNESLQAVDLASGKTIHEVAVSRGVKAFGFAGKDQAFLHDSRTVRIVDLTTSETLNTIDLGEVQDRRSRSSAWQKVGDRLFVVGPDNTLCGIDLKSGKLSEKIAVESRAGIQDFRIEGAMVYCIGSPNAWGAVIDHITCVNLKTKKITESELGRVARGSCRLAGGSNGAAFLIDGKQIERFDQGKRAVTFAPKLGDGVQLLGVWQNQAIVGMKGLILFLDVVETPLTKK